MLLNNRCITIQLIVTSIGIHSGSVSTILTENNNLGKQAIFFWVEKYPGTLNPRFNKKYIIKSIELILNNSFPIRHQKLHLNLWNNFGKQNGTITRHSNLSILKEKSLWNNWEKCGNNIKLILLYCGKDTSLIASYFGIAHVAVSTINKIYSQTLRYNLP